MSSLCLIVGMPSVANSGYFSRMSFDITVYLVFTVVVLPSKERKTKKNMQGQSKCQCYPKKKQNKKQNQRELSLKMFSSTFQMVKSLVFNILTVNTRFGQNM
ncbi:hypothetical protein PanWU01x14_353050 [Parasponia andersonii]|uniref:Transmembrane protein n=1 Tax=Parasponia andersonii TaxID=3476 RepID=A0A2P5AA47_PARAD|nr:hypothetical protein PanWU01x14_353050 [Parasponia andersonii]